MARFEQKFFEMVRDARLTTAARTPPFPTGRWHCWRLKTQRKLSITSERL